MKKNPGLLTVVIIFSVITISCNKDVTSTDNSNQNPNPNPVVQYSNSIFKWYSIDSSASSQDTTDVNILSYDAQNRVTKISYFFSETPGAVPYSVVDYYYNGSDSLPYRSYNLYAETSYHDTINTFFFYDGSGRRIKDSIIRSYKSIAGITTYNISRTIKQYNYTASGITGLSTEVSTSYSSPGGTFNNTYVIKDTVTLDANRNFISAIKNYYGGQTRYLTNSTYNTETNVFSHLNIRNCFDMFPDENFNLAIKNNPVHITQDRISSTSSTTSNFDYTYMYNNNGLVGEIIIINSDFGPGHYDKNVFVYQ